MKSCRQCAQQFEITADDLAFYDKVSPVIAGKKQQIPPPTLCPDCRFQRRLAFRNERKLYNRKCDLSGRQIVSMYSPDSPYKVFDQDAWWGDKWDGLDYGHDYDFMLTFSEQLKDLYRAVPHMSLYTKNPENSYYSNFTLNQKNCYLIFGGSDNQDCLYGKFMISDKDCVDGLSVYGSELCYEGVASEKCYSCRFFTNSRGCSDCLMIDDCQSCKNCIGCFGLKSKQYHVFNQAVGREKYEEAKKEYEYLTHGKISLLREKLNQLRLGLPNMASRIFGSEDCSGDNIFNSKNCFHSFDTSNSENCRYMYFTTNSHDSHDITFNAPVGTQFCYNVCSTLASNCTVTFYIWYGDNVHYSIECHHSRDLFGCVSLKRKQYCILNKQYTREQYETLVPKIIEHMKKTGEWGEYFPYELSPYGYNETLAQEYFPLKKEQAVKLGAFWREEAMESSYIGRERYEIPDDISAVDDDICKKVLKCEVSGKYYKIIPEELRFYRNMKLPIPKRCPDQRHIDRLALHNPYKLWNRKCSRCGADIQTTYAPARPEIVYCESCYLKEVY